MPALRVSGPVAYRLLARVRRRVYAVFLAHLCLREQEIDRGYLDENPHAVDNVVFPTDGIERDGIHVCVEEDGYTHGKLLYGNALRSLAVGEYLYQVRVGKSIPPNVVESGVQSAFLYLPQKNSLRVLTVSRQR